MSFYSTIPNSEIGHFPEIANSQKFEFVDIDVKTAILLKVEVFDLKCAHLSTFYSLHLCTLD